MKAIGYIHSTPKIQNDSLQELELKQPIPKSGELLVNVKAVSVNPVDFKIRRSRGGSAEAPVILGWDAAGVVDTVGAGVRGFTPGDRVYYAGDISKAGSNAEFQIIDARLVGKMPERLGFGDAASLPLTALTAFEALFEVLQIPKQGKKNVLIIGGAGGVGSIAIQALKTHSDARVFATAGRPESRAWLADLRVDHILDRKRPLIHQVREAGVDQVDYVFSTTHTDQYVDQIIEVLTPFGALVMIDDPSTFDISPFKRKSIRVGWELMFTKSLFNHRPESQGEILTELSRSLDTGKIRATVNTRMKGMTVENFTKAHRLLESGESIGKIVIEF